MKSRSHGLGHVAMLAVGAVATVSLLAQAPSLTQPPQPISPQQPTFRAGVTLVTTDVIVRDRTGQFVADLAKQDFEVFEDGQPQQIASLVLVHGGRVFNQLTPAAPVQEGIILPPSRPPSDTAGRVFVLFVDDLHLEAYQTPRVRSVFRRIADTLIHEGDLFGVVSSGPSSIAIDMTYDRSRLREAEDKIMGDGLSPKEIIEGMQGPRGPAELLFRAHQAFKTAYTIVRNLERVQNRRKAFIYLSVGYDFDPFPEARIYGGSQLQQAARNERNNLGPGEEAELYDDIPDARTDPFERLLRQGTAFADADLAMELSELTKAANRSNTSFYAIDPRGLLAGPEIDQAHYFNTSEWFQYVMKTQNSLRVLAEQTGGLAVVNRNDFEDALKQIDAETSDYYVLGYYASNPDPTMRTRRIEVNVNRDGVQVRSRRTYTFKREPAPVEAPLR